MLLVVCRWHYAQCPTLQATMHPIVQLVTRALRLQIPQLALLYYNNCQHVAHEVLLLPYAFSPHLDSVGGRPVDFLDAARRLREAGRESLDAQVSLSPCIVFYCRQQW